METNEMKDAELATHLKDSCQAPATPSKGTEDAVWLKVDKKLQRKGETKRMAPVARRTARWWMAATAVAAGLLIAVMLTFRGDPSWDMAAALPDAKKSASQTTLRPPALPRDSSSMVKRDAEESSPKTTPFIAQEKADGLIHAPGHIEVPVPEWSETDTRSRRDGKEVADHREVAHEGARSSTGDKKALEFDLPKPSHIGTPAKPPKNVRLAPDEKRFADRAAILDVASSEKARIHIGSEAGKLGRVQNDDDVESVIHVPPMVDSSKPKGKKYEATPPTEPAARPATPDVKPDTRTGSKRDPVSVAADDTRGTEIEELKAKAAELNRKIREAERTKARTAPRRPHPYANLQEIKPNVQVLTGGVQDDNIEFNKFLGFLSQTSAPGAIKWNLSERVMIEVTDVKGLPLTNADVRIECDGRMVHKVRTFSNGMALFHPGVINVNRQSQSFRVTVVPPPGCQGRSLTQSFTGRSGTWRVQVPYARSQNAVKLDILLCLDCTGSMSDEIERVQKTLQMMVQKFNALPGKPQTRWGLVQYRDRGDQYVTRVHNFTSDVSQFQARLNACSAGGGGDEPESVNEALDKAVESVSWDRGDAIRLIFLVGDAPPHMDYANDVKYTSSMAKAQRRAIKIYPLAASGLNKTGEVIFRQMAQYTLARFLFISYGGGTPHAVSKPGQSNNLDDLIVHIVAAEVNSRTKARRAPYQIEDPDRWE